MPELRTNNETDVAIKDLGKMQSSKGTGPQDEMSLEKKIRGKRGSRQIGRTTPGAEFYAFTDSFLSFLLSRIIFRCDFTKAFLPTHIQMFQWKNFKYRGAKASIS